MVFIFLFQIKKCVTSNICLTYNIISQHSFFYGSFDIYFHPYKCNCICGCPWTWLLLVSYQLSATICEGDTPLPPCVLRTALFWHCVLRTQFLVSRTAYRLTTKKQPFLRFHSHKADGNDSILHAHVQSFLQTFALMCLLVRFPSI